MNPIYGACQDLAALLRDYDRPGPRYTSYPTAVEFHDSFDDAAYQGRLQVAAGVPDEPLSLYIHLPFCEERCSFCGCNVIITQKREVADRYLHYLEQEIAMLARTLERRRRVVQLHWGGGTPTYLSPSQIQRLHQVVTDHFTLDAAAEIAIEIDPRVTTSDQLVVLRSLGFTRLSMGVQDFTPEVQEAINRRQSEPETQSLFEHARAVGFEAINIDLVYGLPRQALATFRRTLDSVVDMQPDRIAVYSYAHVPWLRPHQKQIQIADLPDAGLKLDLFAAAATALLTAGYVHIGMDHFAKPEDELAVASRERRLHRNFMGYTTRCAPDMLGLGVSSIGDVCGAFAQNAKKLSAYYAAIDNGRFSVERGYALSADDLVRRHVITELMCNFHVDRAQVSSRYGIDFDEYFTAELDRLAAGPASHGLLTMSPASLDVPERGRLFVRNICMEFDRYLPAHLRDAKPVFSRTI